ncbi:hypothetical protein Bcoa_3131 [Heyndrickxia coagulans 36D1]|uniref:Uncharacterized protein n=2 Tax=Heyndrickxia coagulans TaxID=1398 RepID=G2TPV9_HEYCO|nr:hypothetical protein Bcoa_3131 [Heyndrickxia coagulans 36D1]KWZ81046.1 hypothetical protein HMPREF3213_02131 [Heyndrickxia coagulans]
MFDTVINTVLGFAMIILILFLLYRYLVLMKTKKLSKIDSFFIKESYHMNNIPNKQFVRFLKLRYIFSAAILFLFLIVVLYFKTVNSLVIPLLLLIEFTGISVIDHKIKKAKNK